MSINRVNDNDFEMQTIGQPISAPWTSVGTTLAVGGGAQRAGSVAAELSAGALIEQTLKHLQPGKAFQFIGAFAMQGLTGTLDVHIGNSVVKKFEASSASGLYTTYSFIFEPPSRPGSTPTLRFTNNTNGDVLIDELYIFPL